MSNKIGFVILHYMTLDDTVTCVKSILSHVKNPIITIVDNASGNKTGIELQKIYKTQKNIKVIINKKNLGFSKGNNIGIEYLKTNYDCDFIVIMNNDTQILSDNIEKDILEEYNNSKFAVLGPQIITKDGSLETNPVSCIIDSKAKAVKILTRKILKYIFLTVGLDLSKKRKKHNSRYNHNKRYENVKLHGACWILSKNFFKRFKRLNEATFLYFEEDILYLELTRHHMKTVYNPKIKIYHSEDSSTNTISNKSRKVKLFVLKNEIKSILVLYNILKKTNREQKI